ncbi:MAG: CNNM domain-containing protein [Phycisphaeraceae bacterium]
MSLLALTFWSMLMLVGFAGSALFSGLETGAYSLNRVRLEIYNHQRQRPAIILRRMLDNPTTLLTTLLIGNNVTNYLGTGSLAVILEGHHVGELQAMVINALIMTTALFVFGETLPKDLFAAHADWLMYRLARVLLWSRRLFTWIGLVPVINFATEIAMKRIGGDGHARPFHPRRQVEVLVKEGVGYGLLSDDQSAMVARVLDLGTRRLRDEMTEWEDVITVKLDDEADVLWDLADRTSRTRFPVVDDKGRVIGALNVMDALRRGRAHCPPVRELMEPVVRLPATMPLRRGLAELQRRRVAMAVVVDENEQPVGIVTVKDLVEPITGELVSW